MVAMWGPAQHVKVGFNIYYTFKGSDCRGVWISLMDIVDPRAAIWLAYLAGLVEGQVNPVEILSATDLRAFQHASKCRQAPQLVSWGLCSAKLRNTTPLALWSRRRRSGTPARLPS